jgi:hypothetical protein
MYWTRRQGFEPASQPIEPAAPRGDGGRLLRLVSALRRHRGDPRRVLGRATLADAGAEAAIPVFVIEFYLVQRPKIGRLGRLSANGYAYSFIFFTGTVVYALIERPRNYNALADDLSPWMTVHGALMVFAGVGFGYAVVAARILPRWTGGALGSGVVLVAAAQGAPEGVQLLAAGIRDLAFAGMGMALLRSDRSMAPVPADHCTGSAARISASKNGFERGVPNHHPTESRLGMVMPPK